jgi:chromosome segregation ATPase
MKAAGVLRALFLSCAALLLPATQALLIDQHEAGGKDYPVTKVVDLLKSLKGRLEAEQDADEEVYDKLACWCETNDKEKTKAIADAEMKISQLDATVEKMTALSQTLKIEIAALEKEVETNQKSLDTATALREKQAADFNAEENEMIQSIRALDSAIVVLSHHHEGEALISAKALAQVAGAAQNQLQRHATLLQGTITPRQRRFIASLTQKSNGGGNGAFPAQAYAPQSGEIFGILKQMKETFEFDLSESQKEELEARKTYEALKAAKEVEIATGKASIQDKTEQLADAEERLTSAKQEREDTYATLSADQKFLMELKVKCALTDKEWEERQQIRQSELTAIAKALEVLTSDDARDLFSRTFNFLQVKQDRKSQLRAQASRLLAAAAAKSGNKQLALVAQAAKIDQFLRVKKAIDDLVSALLAEKDEEIKHRDYCIEELNLNERATEKEIHTKATLETKIEGLESELATYNGTLQQLEADIVELQTERQRAKEDREAEKAEYEIVVKDQRDSQALLTSALEFLKESYPQSKSAALVQKRGKGAYGPPPPPGFSTQEKDKDAPGILGLMELLIEKAQDMEAKATKAENDARDSYTAFVQLTTETVEAKQAAILTTKAEIASLEQDLIQTKSELEGSVAELEALGQNAVALHGSCDYILKNFEVRQEARDQEVEALRQAKAILSGMQAE